MCQAKEKSALRAALFKFRCRITSITATYAWRIRVSTLSYLIRNTSACPFSLPLSRFGHCCTSHDMLIPQVSLPNEHALATNLPHGKRIFAAEKHDDNISGPCELRPLAQKPSPCTEKLSIQRPTAERSNRVWPSVLVAPVESRNRSGYAWGPTPGSSESHS